MKGKVYLNAGLSDKQLGTALQVATRPLNDVLL